MLCREGMQIEHRESVKNSYLDCLTQSNFTTLRSNKSHTYAAYALLIYLNHNPSPHQSLHNDLDMPPSKKCIRMVRKIWGMSQVQIIFIAIFKFSKHPICFWYGPRCISHIACIARPQDISPRNLTGAPSRWSPDCCCA